VQVTWNKDVFHDYVVGGGLLDDVSSLCEYVDHHRSYLNVHPQWNKTTDCISDQIQQANQTLLSFEKYNLADLLGTINPSSASFTAANADASLLLLYWASLTMTSGYLLVVESSGDSNAPIWICANFSLRSYVSSLNSNPKTASEIYSRWRSAFSDYGSASARKYQVPVIVGSQAFTVPMLAEEVLNSIIFAGIVSVSGFVGCILLFTWSLSVTAMGSLLIVEVAAITICVHQIIVATAFDLLDVVVIVAIVGMLVDFPAHVLLYVVHKRQQPNVRRKATVLAMVWLHYLPQRMMLTQTQQSQTPMTLL